MYLPFIGRLHPWEYLMLLFSFFFLVAESFARFVTLALPSPIYNLLYRASRRTFNFYSSPEGRKSRSKHKAISTAIAKASDFSELCEIWGYQAEEHVVQTRDGYLLGIHRLAYKGGEEDQRVNAGKGSLQKKVVYLHHGLMMSSEVWCCLTEKEKCLPFTLVEKGYDVWLGNNRGNKYSKKSTKHSPTDPAFWSFSIDQFAFHDIPDSVDYILSTTQRQSLTYIGFSQGTAQAFAALSIHPQLNEKVNCFIALAPAMAPPGLADGIVASLVKTSPDVLFLAFGRRAMLTSTTMWQALFYPPIFVRILDRSLDFLFGWKTQNISAHQKLAAYPHLYSFTSTKSVVHWFQIIRNGTFQMYDDDLQSPLSLTDPTRYYKVAKFPTKNIRTPIVLVYGGSDSLVNIDVMAKELPKHTVRVEVPHYEHLDFLWAHDVDAQVFPHVFAALEKHSSLKPEANEDSRRISPRRALTWQKSIDQIGPASGGEDSDVEQSVALPNVGNVPRKHTETIISSHDNDSEGHGLGLSTGLESPRATPTRSRSSKRQTPIRVQSSSPGPGSGGLSHITERTSTSRPEGWWSSDDVAATEPDTPLSSKTPEVASMTQREETSKAANTSSKAAPGELREMSPSPIEAGPWTATRQSISRGSQSSAELPQGRANTATKASFGAKGIRLGIGRPTEAVSRDGVTGEHAPVPSVTARVLKGEVSGSARDASVGSMDSEGKRRRKRRKE